jgi:hypothetical protein
VKVQRFVVSMAVAAGCLLVLPVLARPQSQPRPTQRTREQTQARVEQAQARFQISVMEGVLERAVENAARVLNLQMQSNVPALLWWGSAARARGFRLEGYGVFFDVDVPNGPQSQTWLLQVLEPPESALKSLREHVRSLTNSKEREQLDLALRQIEVQFPARVGLGQADRGKPQQEPSASPDEIYTNAVTAALVDSMLDYSGPLQIAPDEWLTIAAGDYEGRRAIEPGAPYELVTIVMRINGSDLQAFRAGRLTRDEARKRVEVKEF